MPRPDTSRDSAEHTFTVGKGGPRLDVYLTERLPGVSRAAVQRLIKDGNVQVNGKAERPSYRTEPGDVIHARIPPSVPLDAAAEDMGLQVLHEDRDIIVVNKPAGLAVHPAPGNLEHTLVNGLLAQVDDLSSIGGVERPGIVHRLDKDTSGIIIVAKNDTAHRALARQFEDRETLKEYVALVRGYPQPAEGIIDAAVGRDHNNRKRMAITVGGRNAVTRYRTIARFHGCTLLEVHPETGRTHQIRVHMAAIGHAIVGDSLYGGRTSISTLDRQFLHARKLTVRHPTTGEAMTFTAPLFPDLARVLRDLTKDNPADLESVRYLL
jgi:23S rRNA pseudouridine1911/1915/1917 synthase